MRFSADIIERVLADKHYWRRLAAQVIAEATSQNVPRGEVDSAIAPALGEILESRLQRRDLRVRLVEDPGPRTIPMIVEVKTVDPEKGVLLSQSQARRLRRQWDRGRLRGQQQVQNADMPDAMKDHPGVSCDDEHPGMSHDDYMDSEEEEEHSNPLYRQNSARARTILPSRRARER